MVKERCWKCKGSRVITCEGCKGSGTARGMAIHEYERKALGMGPSPCSRCGGSRKTDCDICEGKGYQE